MWLLKQSDRTLSLLVFVSASLWGLYWIPLRQIESFGLANGWSAALFNGCPLLLLVPALLFLPGRKIRDGRRVALVALFCGFGLSFYALGLVATTVVRATLLFYLTPVWSTIIGMIWLREKLDSGRVLAILLGFSGMVVLLSGRGGSGVPVNIGDILALLSGASWGMGAACLKKWPQTPILASSSAQFFVTAAVSAGLGYLIFRDPLPAAEAVVRSLPVAVLTATIVLGPTVLLIFWISTRLFPGRMGILMMSEVIVAIASAWILLSEERMTLFQSVGALAIVAACFVDVLWKRPTGPKSENPMS